MLDVARFLDSLSALPVETRQAGDVILRKGQATGRLFILKQGAVEVLDGERRIAEASEPGAVFGELAVLLNQPHMADVRVVAPSTFHVADGKVFLRVHRDAAVHVACILARRLMAAHCNLDLVKAQLEYASDGAPLGPMVDAVDRSLLWSLMAPPQDQADPAARHPDRSTR
ncbi:MAG: cyclic nucleotide-binding domain-containing protein [Pseudomonadota bacterium]